MRTFQAKRCKISFPSKTVGIFVIFVMLASCADNQNAFFTQRDALINKGYTWQKLAKCRPATEGVPSIPVIGANGRKLVCYVLVAPQNDVVASTTTITPGQSPVPPSSTARNPATTSNTNSETLGIIWNFSNF